jgi:hypothetical protein
MGRTKGAANKAAVMPQVYTFSEEERLRLIATLLIEIVCEELCNTAS